MSNVIDIKQTIDSSPVLNALAKEQSEVRKLRKELDGLKTGGKQAGAAIGSTANNVGRAAMQAVSALTGVGGAVSALLLIANQLKAEVANLRSTQSEAGGKQIELGRIYANIAANIPQGKSPQQDALNIRTMVDRLATATGQTRLRAGMSLNAGLAGAGPETDAQVRAVEDATRAALNTFGSAGDEEVKLMTGAGVDLTKAYGFRSPEESLGYLQRVGQVSRIEDPKPLAEHAAPALAKSAAFGSSPESAGALFGLLTSRMVDKEGVLSATVFGRLEDALRDRFPTLPDTESRIKEMQAHPELVKPFFGGGEFGEEKFGKASIGRANAKPILEQLFKAGSEIDQEWQQRKRQMGQRLEWEGVDQRRRATIAAIPELQQERLKREIASGTEGVQAANMTGATGGISREGLTEILKATGLLDVEQKAAMLEFEWNTGLGATKPIEEVSRQLRARAHRKRNPWDSEPDYFGGTGDYFENPALATDEDKVTAAILESTAAAIDRTAERGANAQGKAIGADAERAAKVNVNAKPEALKRAEAELRHQRLELKTDTSRSEEQRDAARNAVISAEQAAAKATAGLPPEQAKELTAVLRELVTEVVKLRDTTQDNTNATKNIAQQPAGAGIRTTGIVPGPRASSAHSRPGGKS